MILGVELLITRGQTISIHNIGFNKLVVTNIGGFLPVAAAVAAAVFAVVWLIFHRTPFGRHVAAIGGDERAAVGAGINIKAETKGAVVVGGGTSLTGGRGNLFGTVCAAGLLAAIEAGLNVVNVSSLYDDLVFGGILIIALMVDGLRRGSSRRGSMVT